MFKSDKTLYVVDIVEPKTSDVTHTIIPYETIRQYNSKLPAGETKITSPGVNGFIVEYGKVKKTIQEPVSEIVEVGTGKAIKYTGIMTGYGPDCKGCSKVGNVACHTKDASKHSLINDGIYYEDDTYGEVRILAAYREVFPCGTMIKITNDKKIDDIKLFIGI